MVIIRLSKNRLAIISGALCPESPAHAHFFAPTHHAAMGHGAEILQPNYQQNKKNDKLATVNRVHIRALTGIPLFLPFTNRVWALEMKKLPTLSGGLPL